MIVDILLAAGFKRSDAGRSGFRSETYTRVAHGHTFAATILDGGVGLIKDQHSDPFLEGTTLSAPLLWHREPSIFRDFLEHETGPRGFCQVPCSPFYQAFRHCGFTIKADGTCFADRPDGLTITGLWFGNAADIYISNHSELRLVFRDTSSESPLDRVIILGPSSFWLWNPKALSAVIQNIVPEYLERIKPSLY